MVGEQGEKVAVETPILCSAEKLRLPYVADVSLSCAISVATHTAPPKYRDVLQTSLARLEYKKSVVLQDLLRLHPASRWTADIAAVTMGLTLVAMSWNRCAA